MNVNLTRIGALALVASGSITVPCGGQTVDTSEVKAIVADAMNARYALHSSIDLLSLRAGDIGLIELRELDGLRLWRGQAWTLSHSRPFLVADHATVLWRLGGFDGPELLQLSRTMNLPRNGVEGIIRRSRTFAYVLDQNGADSVLFQADAVGDGPGRRFRQEGWPADTVYASGDEIVVRMTVFSRATYLPGQPWQPAGYTFLFSVNGSLISWSRRLGDYFP